MDSLNLLVGVCTMTFWMWVVQPFVGVQYRAARFSVATVSLDLGVVEHLCKITRMCETQFHDTIVKRAKHFF
jgi:Na+/glutamate symporter